MESLLEQPLGDIERPHPVLGLERPGRQHHLVHARSVEGDVVGAVQPPADPVGVQHGHLGDALQAVAPVDQDVGQRTGQHQRVAVPGVHPPDRPGRVGPAVHRVVESHRTRAGEERHQTLGHRHRAGPRPSPTVRGGERLVQVHVHDVEAHVARPDDAQDGVEVGAVVVEQPPDAVDGGGDLGDVLLEESEGVRIGQHDAGDVLVEDRPQRGHVHASAIVAGHRDHLVAAQGHRRRVGAVGGVRDDDLVPCRPLGVVPGPHEEQTGELAGRTRCRLQGGRGHAGHLAQRLLQLDEQLQPPLGQRRPEPPGAPRRARVVRPRCRTPSGCTSWCTTRADRRPGRRRTVGGRAG